LDIEADASAEARSMVFDAHAIFVLPNVKMTGTQLQAANSLSAGVVPCRLAC